MECRFVVGQKVVCVDASPRKYSPMTLKEGQIYTVTWAGLTKGNTNVACTVLEASPSPKSSGAFCADRFKPLEETKSSESQAIRLFRKIARGVTDGNLVVPDPVSDRLRKQREHQS